MKISKFIFSKTQCAILATMLALSSLSLGCDDITSDYPAPPDLPTKPILEGTWIEIGNQNNVLFLSGSSGFHSVNPEDNNADKVYIEFLYNKISSSMLRVTMTKNRINGITHPVREQEDLHYILDNRGLRIFNQSFVKVNPAITM